MIFKGFEPYVNKNSTMLILGSFPSVKSREEGFYYGNKQNKFWRVVAESFNRTLPQSIDEKKALLEFAKIALWDIVTACEIKGSMDKDIINPVIADIPNLISRYPVKKVVTNGATAHKLFIGNFPELKDLCVALPSTSPANARLNVNIWIDTLRKLQRT